MNRVAGFCMPNVSHKHERDLVVPESNMDERLVSKVGMKIISAIPCYCDIQFSAKEYLTVLNYPEHPFATQINNLSEEEEIKV